jgi:hypothetical protein
MAFISVFTGAQMDEAFGFAINGAAKAWMALTATTNTLLASDNIASVTDNSAGNFTMNFTTSFADTNYAAFDGRQNANAITGTSVTFYVYAVGSLRLESYENGSAADATRLSVSIQGTLA